MSKHNPVITLHQMREAAQHVQSLCQGVTLEQFEVDWARCWGVERGFEIIGEATKRLPAELREQYPQVAWKKVAGIRDVISHGYDVLDYEVLWDAVFTHLPILLTTIEQMLADIGGDVVSDE